MQSMADERVQSSDLISGMRKNIQNVIPFIGLIGIIAVFSIITSGRILAVTNMKLIVNQSIILMIACIGVTFVMSMGSLDFSQGSILAITAVVAAVISRQSIIISFFAALTSSFVEDLFNNSVKVKKRTEGFSFSNNHSIGSEFKYNFQFFKLSINLFFKYYVWKIIKQYRIILLKIIFYIFVIIILNAI